MNTFFKISLFTFLFILFTSCAADPDSNEHGFTGVADGEYDNSTLSWSSANLTWFESYPDPGSEECIEYNGCTWAGQLAYFGGAAQTETWVKNTNIIAVHSDDWNQYIGKILRIRNGSNQIDAMVYDLCSDADCDGCCTRNMSSTGFLIDMEINTFNRYGGDGGVVEWACLNCN
jgi:hypothetical protein